MIYQHDDAMTLLQWHMLCLILCLNSSLHLFHVVYVLNGSRVTLYSLSVCLLFAVAPKFLTYVPRLCNVSSVR